jgi:hypothetical protein
MGIILCILLLFAAGFVLASVYYFHRTTTKARLFLVGIRSVLIAALVCALIEPVLKFERLSRTERIIPVLLDVSASMRLFHPDSTVMPFLRSLAAVTKDNAGAEVKIVPYCFGDSLRRCGPIDAVRFSDRQSILPVSFQEKSALLSPLFLIITDGNFSNASMPRELFQDRTCLYCELPPVSPQPFLTAGILSVNDHAILDSLAVAVVLVHGYCGTAGDLSITCKEKSRVLTRLTTKIKTGFFSDTMSIRLPTSVQGRFLYTVTVASVGDTLRRALYFPQTVISNRFTARIVSGAPSLDRRFLTLALQNDPQWYCVGSTAKECDALFIFDFNRAMADTIPRVTDHGIEVFLGAPACEERQTFSPTSFSLVPFQPDDSLFQQLAAADLPPPLFLYKCSAPFLSRQRPILGYIVARDKTEQDTIPFLSAGFFERHDAIAVAGHDLWRMDFLPLSITGRTETGSFLGYVTDYVKQQITVNNSRNFFVFPSAAEVYENDSILFNVLLPSDFNDIPAGSDRYGKNTGCFVQFTVDSLSRRIYATGNVPVNLKAPLGGIVALPPLAGGTYYYRCSFEAKGLVGNFADSLYVEKNREELSVAGQNTTLLDQFSFPLKKNSPQALLDAYAGAFASKRTTTFDAFEIHRSWILLSVIILLMTAEWVVRRKQELE